MLLKKILILADINSVHTKKIIKSLLSHNFSIYLFGLSNYVMADYEPNEKLKIHSMFYDDTIVKNYKSGFSKLIYLSSLKKIKKIIMTFQPDLLHAHYATSYGMLAALTGFHPYILSVWGTDVYAFPKKSLLHKNLLKFNLSKTDAILSTSKAMAIETKKYTNKNIEITPFGIDVDLFRPIQYNQNNFKNEIVLGAVKSLEHIYGIDRLIFFFKEILNRVDIPLKLIIVGSGTKESELKQLVSHYNLENNVVFTGRILHDRIPEYLETFDIYFALSRSESFGVSVLEASAMQIPVVVSNVGGLPEVVINEKTGIIIDPDNIESSIESIISLVKNKEKRTAMGIEGRKFVIENYTWENTINNYLSIYKNVILKNCNFKQN